MGVTIRSAFTVGFRLGSRHPACSVRLQSSWECQPSQAARARSLNRDRRSKCAKPSKKPADRNTKVKSRAGSTIHMVDAPPKAQKARSEAVKNRLSDLLPTTDIAYLSNHFRKARFVVPGSGSHLVRLPVPDTHLPIAPDRLFVAVNSKDLGGCVQDRPQKELVEETNVRTAQQAAKYVYGNDNARRGSSSTNTCRPVSSRPTSRVRELKSAHQARQRPDMTHCRPGR